MSTTPVNADAELVALKARFATLIAFEGAAAVLAFATLVGYFAAHLAWCLPLFGALLVVAVAAQIWFIAAFRQGSGGRDAGKGL